MSESVGIAELRQNLSKYLKLVAHGESLVVTDHNRPVAMLGPVPARKMSAKLERLIAEGRVRPAQNRTGVIPPPPEPEVPSQVTSEEILEYLRGERDDELPRDS